MQKWEEVAQQAIIDEITVLREMVAKHDEDYRLIEELSDTIGYLHNKISAMSEREVIDTSKLISIQEVFEALGGQGQLKSIDQLRGIMLVTNNCANMAAEYGIKLNEAKSRIHELEDQSVLDLNMIRDLEKRLDASTQFIAMYWKDVK